MVLVLRNGGPAPIAARFAHAVKNHRRRRWVFGRRQVVVGSFQFRRANALSARWQAQGSAGALDFLGTATCAATGAYLLGHRGATGTELEYQRHWDAFFTYCGQAGDNAFLANPTTVVRYTGSIYARETVRGVSFALQLPPLGLNTTAWDFLTLPRTPRWPQCVVAVSLNMWYDRRPELTSPCTVVSSFHRTPCTFDSRGAERILHV